MKGALSELDPKNWTPIQPLGCFMTKYSEQLKLRMMKQYLDGGTPVLAGPHGVSRAVLRRWVAAYEQRGP